MKLCYSLVEPFETDVFLELVRLVEELRFETPEKVKSRHIKYSWFHNFPSYKFYYILFIRAIRNFQRETINMIVFSYIRLKKYGVSIWDKNVHFWYSGTSAEIRNGVRFTFKPAFIMSNEHKPNIPYMSVP